MSCLHPQVVLLPAPRRASDPVPTFTELTADKAALWQKPRWAPGVLVHPSGTHPKRGTPLHVRLMQLTARACAVCDAGGRRPFPTDKLLREHLAQEHDRRLCQVCWDAGRR